MRGGSVVLCALAPLPLLLVALTWLLAATLPVCAQLDAAEPFEKVAESRNLPGFTRTLSAKDVKQAVKKAPEKLRLGQNNFLNSGLRRKSVAGAYGTTAGVTLGAAAITYQTLNLRSKNRDAETKKQKDIQVKGSICAALEMRRREAWLSTHRNSYTYGIEPPARVAMQPELGRRALSDETLNTIEDYNKIIGATEALASGGIAMTAA